MFSASINGSRACAEIWSVKGLVQTFRFESALRFAGLCNQLVDGRGDLLAAGVAEVDGADDFLFGGMLGTRLHHHDAAFGGRHNDIQLGLAALRVGGVGHVFALHHAHAHSAQHMMERDVGDGQRGARAYYR